MLFTEDFLHYVWKFRLFERTALQTTAGESIEIYSAGIHNRHAGPDFQNARLKIGDTTWAGSVEIHLSASDWYKHDHGTDDSYNNVILHVVYNNDAGVATAEGRQIPTLELKDRISPDLYNRYHQLIFGTRRIIPCEGSIYSVDSLTMRNWLTRILVERLEKRSEGVLKGLEANRGDWEETFYQCLAANFGFKVNALPFEMLAKSLPQVILSKHKNSALQIEALIFGQAGLLNDDFTDTYPLKLKAEYEFLRKKFDLKPIDKHLWKFLRLRPLNFPTIRLAQFAALIVQSNHLLSKILEIREIADLRKLFTELQVNAYWETHYRFDTAAKSSTKELGQSSIDLILLNTLALFLFCYGKQHQLQHYVSRSLKLLELLPAEQNSIIADFHSLGVKINTAFESQALLELKNSYCDYKKCLQCSVGNKILKLT